MGRGPVVFGDTFAVGAGVVWLWLGGLAVVCGVVGLVDCSCGLFWCCVVGSELLGVLVFSVLRGLLEWGFRACVGWFFFVVLARVACGLQRDSGSGYVLGLVKVFCGGLVLESVGLGWLSCIVPQSSLCVYCVCVWWELVRGWGLVGVGGGCRCVLRTLLFATLCAVCCAINARCPPACRLFLLPHPVSVLSVADGCLLCPFFFVPPSALQGPADLPPRGDPSAIFI